MSPNAPDPWFSLKQLLSEGCHSRRVLILLSIMRSYLHSLGISKIETTIVDSEVDISLKVIGHGFHDFASKVGNHDVIRTD